MTRYTRSLSAVALAVLFTGILGCNQEVPKPAAKTGEDINKKSGEVKRGIIISNGEDPFWDACNSGMKDAALKFHLKEAGYNAVFVKNDGKVRGQINLLSQYATQGDVAAIGISVISKDNVALADQMKALRKKGIKIITIDSDLDTKKFPDSREYYVGTNNLIGGRVLGICARHLLPEGGEYATFVGLKGAQNAIDRIDGFADGAGKKFKSVASRGDGIVFPTAVKNVRNVLLDHKDLKLLVGIYAYNGPAIADVVEEEKSRAKYKIVTFDAAERSIKRMGEDMMDVMVVQDPYHMGYYGIQLLKAMLDGDDKAIAEMQKNLPAASGAKDVFDTPLKVIVPNSGSPLKKEMFRKGVEFLTLDEFKKWLKLYGLVSS